MREERALHINLGQYVVGNQPELVPFLCPGIRFGLRCCGERGEPGLRLRAHPPLANRAEGEPAAGAGRRGAGFGEEEAAADGEREGSRPDCLGF